jgi:hypothetical protein
MDEAARLCREFRISVRGTQYAPGALFSSLPCRPEMRPGVRVTRQHSWRWKQAQRPGGPRHRILRVYEGGTEQGCVDDGAGPCDMCWPGSGQGPRPQQGLGSPELECRGGRTFIEERSETWP